MQTETRESSNPSPSLFVPLNDEQAQTMAAQQEELKVIEAEIEAAARKRDAELVQETQAKLEEIRQFYLDENKKVVAEPFRKLKSELRTQYLQSLQQAQQSLAPESTVLAEQLGAEMQRVQQGEPVPYPPAPGDPSNPGLKPLFELRRWYHTSQAQVQDFRTTNLASLTASYRQQLQQYNAWAQGETNLPPDARDAVAQGVAAFDLEGWWKAAKLPPPDP